MERFFRAPPRVSKFENKYVVVQGQDFSLACEASGEPKPSIRWTMSGVEVGQNVPITGNVLRIIAARPENSGVYICIAENSGGSDQAHTIIEVERK